MADPKVGMVQARWGHLNREHSLLTRTQALMLDGHHLVENRARAAAGWLFNFSGTGGMWRKEAIASAGGWQHDTLTEDLDLSYRAQLAGWRFVYRENVVTPAELPEDISAFRAQQFRWAKGTVQTARKLLGRILRRAAHADAAHRGVLPHDAALRLPAHGLPERAAPAGARAHAGDRPADDAHDRPAARHRDDGLARGLLRDGRGRAGRGAASTRSSSSPRSSRSARASRRT